jgi:TPR repeat protein
MNFLQSLPPFLPPGKSLLKRNGFDNVTILTTYSDYKMACKAIDFMDIFQKRVCAGQTLSEAMYSAEQTFPDAANFLRHTAREIGQLKGQRNELENIAQFDEPDSLTPEEEKMKRQYFENDETQRVLRTIYDHALKNRKENFGIDDIMDDYDDTYYYFNKAITKKNLTACMRSLNDNGLIQKKGREPGQKGKIDIEYRVQNPNYLRNFLKDEAAYPHANEDYEIADTEESTDSEEAIPVSFGAAYVYCRGYFQLAHAVNFVLIYYVSIICQCIHILPDIAVFPILTSIIGNYSKPYQKEN